MLELSWTWVVLSPVTTWLFLSLTTTVTSARELLALRRRSPECETPVGTTVTSRWSNTWLAPTTSNLADVWDAPRLATRFTAASGAGTDRSVNAATPLTAATVFLTPLSVTSTLLVAFVAGLPNRSSTWTRTPGGRRLALIGLPASLVVGGCWKATFAAAAGVIANGVESAGSRKV